MAKSTKKLRNLESISEQEEERISQRIVANVGHVPEESISCMSFAPVEVVQGHPDFFSSLRNSAMEIESDRTQDVIEMLGNLLEIYDFRTNMTTFWLLDMIAFQVLRLKKKFDKSFLSILISWLAGEAKLIQETNISRETFFQKMDNIFAEMAEQVIDGKPLLHWDLKQDSKAMFNSQSKVSSEKQEVTSQSETKILGTEAEELKETKRPSSSSALLENLSNDADKEQRVIREEMLEKLIDVTYEVYGNAFHYAIVRAAFTEPIEVQNYTLPYTLQTPRPIKSNEPLEPLPVSKKVGKNGKQKSMDNKMKKPVKEVKKGKNVSKFARRTTSSMEIPPPASPLTEEDMLKNKWEFIQPLIEANEAKEMLETFNVEI